MAEMKMMDEGGIEEKAEEGGKQKLRTEKGLSKKKKSKERRKEIGEGGFGR